jgi:geranylgeranyl diphosphate synthase type II
MIIENLLNELQLALSPLRYGESPAELYEPIRYIMDLGGKRLRPLLTLLSARLYTDDLKPFILPALGVEVFHNFTLMHDDIMDKAPLRRGKPTVHTRWNEPIAILSGDVMLVKAYELMMHAPDVCLREILVRFNRCAAEVCEGQQLDMNFENLPTVLEAEYIEMIRLKTAVLLGFALSLGALLAGAPAGEVEKLRALGEHMGIGFQLKDDLLDVFGNADKVGKLVGGDIVANKKTFLLIEALSKAVGEQKAELAYWLQAINFNPVEKVKSVTAIYKNLGIDLLAEERMQHYFGLAYQQLEALVAPAERKAHLREFMDWLIAREH